MPDLPRTPIRLLGAAACCLLLALAGAATAQADAGSAAPNSAPLKELPDLVLTPWLSSQTGHGNFKRPSGTPAVDGYANAGLAYAMLLEAARGGNDAYFRSAMRAFKWISRTRFPMQGVFYQMYSAAAYNLARDSFGSRVQFRHIRRAWANKLRRFPYQKGKLGERYHYNKNLIEALEVIELYNTGLRGNAPGAILANRREALKRALRVMNVWMPRRVADYSTQVGAGQGWPFDTTVAEMSDPPDNPPAYNALVAGMYARAYARLPVTERTERMRVTAETMIRGVIARAAPDGDLAFDGRSQEQAWALSAAAYAAWTEADFSAGPEHDLYLAFARRVINRLETVHVTSASSFGFVLTPAAGCCDRQDRPPGQDNYYDVAKYSGLAAVTMGWSLQNRPDDWQSGDAKLPTDLPSDFVYEFGRGRFYQHRGTDIYWFLREQSDYYDARSDTGVGVMKLRQPDGSWADVVPPRPYTGGHHKPANPAAPCLVFRKGCAYLELHNGVPDGAGGYNFQTIWRTFRKTLVRRGTATVTPTDRGLRLTWSAQPADVYKLDSFLPSAKCLSGAIAGPGITIASTGQVACKIYRGLYAGGARVDMRRIEATITPRDGAVTATWTASSN